MEDILNKEEIRVLGCLMEKEMATPEYYPLSLNSLINACNQKSNREPVVQYDETTVILALDCLKEKKFIWRSDASRVTKYSENFVKTQNLINKEAALMCLLFLRGPQTIGELRGRTDRLFKFSDLEEVKETLENLAEMEMVAELPKMPGRKEARYCHLLGGPPDLENDQLAPVTSSSSQSTSTMVKIESLENEIESLREELSDLKQDLTEFKRQFE